MLSHTVQIPADEDKAFRSFLLGASPWPVRIMLSDVLADGPMPDGAKKAAAYYKFELQNVLIKTVPVVDELEWFRPGFKRWLDATGFGNDRRVIAAFAHWSDMESRGEIRNALNTRAKH